MRTVLLLFGPLALVACGKSTPADAPPAPQTGGVVATTNATVEPVPTETVATAATPAPKEGSVNDSASSCGAEKAAGFVGRNASPDVRAQVAKAVGHLNIRWIGPDDAVTMDYSEGRLNADLDAAGKIKGFRCG